MQRNFLRTAALITPLALILAACGNTPLPEPDPAGLASRVSGTIGGWGDLGTATIETQHRPENADRANFVTLSSGTVKADGSFSIDLPSASAVAPYLVRFQQGPREGCTGEFAQSAPNARHFVISSYALRRSDRSYIGFLVQDRPGDQPELQAGDYFIHRYYVDQSGAVSGTLACPTASITLKLNLKAGWNAVVYTVGGVTPEGKISAYTLTTPGTLPPSEF